MTEVGWQVMGWHSCEAVDPAAGCAWAVWASSVLPAQRTAMSCRGSPGEVRSALSLWFLVLPLYWCPADESTLKDHCQPHAEFSSQAAYILSIWHIVKRSPHSHPMLTFKTFFSMARMSWNLVRLLKVFQRTMINSSSQASFCPLPPKIYLGWMMTNI